MKIAVLDIGGTMIKSGIFHDGTLSHTAETPTESALGGAYILSRAIDLLSKMKPFDRIGISVTGLVNTKIGCIAYSNPTIPHFIGTAFKSTLESHFSVPVTVENDANCAAIGEAYYGAAATQVEKDFVCLTYGTGIGGAIFKQNQIYQGHSFGAGEFGRMITHAECIQHHSNYLAGAYETFASTTALVRRVSSVDDTLINGRLIFSQIQRPEIKKAVDLWIGEILCGLASIIYGFNPSLLVIGGGVMSAPYILPELQAGLARFISPGHLPVEIKVASLGNHAGLMGIGHLSASLTHIV